MQGVGGYGGRDEDDEDLSQNVSYKFMEGKPVGLRWFYLCERKT
jgi:hypothetical protein